MYIKRDIINVDFKRVGSSIGIQIKFDYGVEGFDKLLSIIKSCGGEWSKDACRWIVGGPFAFYCVDLIKSIDAFDVWYTDYFGYYLKSELRKMERNIIQSKSVKPTIKIDVPVPDGKKLFEFQKASVQFFNERGRSILLADDMGSGKTVEAIAIANYNKYKKILVICPDSAKEKVWREAFEDWYVGDSNIHVIYAGKEYKDSDILIINYDLITKFLPDILKSKFKYLIVDEAHMIKSTSTKRTKSIKQISDKIKDKVFLTGTPILNRPIELYSILRVVAGSAFGTKASYAFRYCNGKLIKVSNNGKEKIYLKDDGQSNLNELNFKVRSTVMMRREKSDIINEFPSVSRHVFQIQAEYAGRIDDQYRNEKKRYTKELAKIKNNRNTFFDYKEYTKAVKDIKRYHFDRMALIRRDLGIEKVPDVVNFLKSLLNGGKEKIVLFMHHREAIENIYKNFPNSSVVLYGGLTSKEKSNIVDKFEKDPNIKIFIGSIQASGVAYTLNIAHTVVFGELDWTPSMVDQCEARCVRLGQKNNVDVYYLIVDNSLDQNMLDKIHRKGKMIRSVMI